MFGFHTPLVERTKQIVNKEERKLFTISHNTIQIHSQYIVILLL